jgi:PncC family amidohydrolase
VLEERAGELLRRLGCTVSTAESLTGGLVGAKITSISGSSDYYAGGVISYATSVKGSVLGVAADILSQFGAVSEETASAMASKVRELFGASLGLSTTGVAGPTKQEGHQVGTLFLGIAVPSGVHTVRLQGPQADRATVREWAANEALNLLVKHLEEIAELKDL